MKKELDSIKIKLKEKKYFSDMFNEEKVIRITERVSIDNYRNSEVCSDIGVSYLVGKLESININRMFEIIDDVPYDNDSQEAVACVLRAITQDEDIAPISIKLKNFIESLTSLKPFSDLYFAKLRDAPRYLLLKASMNFESSFTHEYFVNIRCTNKLRSFVPNFIYSYCIVKCTLPIIDTHHNVSSFMTRNVEKMNYLVLEDVKGESLTLKLNNCTYDEFMNYYMQILCALDVASYRFDFTHYDLTPDNIIIRELKYEDFYISYDFGYLACNRLASIFNFEKSHIAYGGANYGYFSSDVGINSKLSNIIGDAYQLLMTSLEIMSKNNKPCFQKCKILRRFFGDEEAIEAINSEKTYNFRLPHQTNKIKYSSIKVSIYIKWIIEKLNYRVFEEMKSLPIKVLNCLDQSCYTKKRFYNDIGVTNSGPIIGQNIDTIPKLYIATHKLINNEKQLIPILRQFNYNIIYPQFIDELEKEIKEGVRDLRKIKRISLRGISQNSLLNVKTLMSFQEFIAGVSHIYDKWVYLEFLIKSADYVLKLFNLKIFESSLKYIKEEYNNVSRRLNDDCEIALDSISYVNDIIKNSHHIWFYNQMKTFNFVFKQLNTFSN